MYKPPTLEDFIATIPVESMVANLSTASGMQKTQIYKTFNTYINEMQVAMYLVAPLLTREQKILEVGAGLCLFSLYLKQAGYDVTALEPAMGGFDVFTIIKQEVLATYQATDLPVIVQPVEMLSPALHGKFDLIFSSNVLEHIPNYTEALRAMSACLTSNGVMIHGCPNYFIPYEPHLQIPVLNFWPQLSVWLFHGQIMRHKDLWQSLNFIDYFTVILVARRLGLQVRFRNKLMYQAIMRLLTNAEFRSRHTSGLINALGYITKFPSILWLIEHLPPWLSTPMIFECRRKL